MTESLHDHDGANEQGNDAFVIPPVTTKINKLLGKGDKYWSDTAADEVVKHFPNETRYTSAAGISPSGIVHFGNFRDVMTSLAVHETLKARGLPARFLFSWDNYDRFRKVPVGVDPSFQQYIGMPLTSVPDPGGEYASYAERFQREFMQAMEQCGIEMEYLSQTDEYTSGRYDDEIVHCLQHREEIAKTLLHFMSDKGKETKGIDEIEYIKGYYPIGVYSRFSGKDNTTVTHYDGGSIIRYVCADSGKEDEVDLRKEHVAKLAWKVDWPMRWKAEGVVFEPGGHDHASPGGSYDTSHEIARKVFGRQGPVFIGYEFIGLRGLTGKMSGSKGQSMSPSQLLKLYEPELLKWLYLRRQPGQKFELAFDSETLRQYAEFDKDKDTFASLPPTSKRAIELSLGGAPTPEQQNAIPFRQAASLGQIVGWSRERLEDLLGRTGKHYGSQSIDKRLPLAQHWMEEYNPDEVINLLAEPNAAHIETMDAATLVQIETLRSALEQAPDADIEALETLAYLPKDPALDEKTNKDRQRQFFRHVYQLLIGKDTGPRLGTFLSVMDRQTVLKLLKVTPAK
jgi:lysyl-tRNA synthetase class 1